MAIPIHPCLCGFTCEAYSHMKKHRRKCPQWNLRPDPLGITIERRKQTRAVRSTIAKAPLCIECRARIDHHAPWCSLSQAEMARNEAIAKHGIDPDAFEAFLRLLAREYRP